MRKQLFVALVLVLVASVLAVACGSTPATTTTIPTGPIKVGHIADLTGFEAQVGQYFDQGLKYAFNSINNQVAGRQIQLITEDSKSTTQGALDAVTKLVESDHVDIILGPTQEGQKGAVADYCKTAGIPAVFYNPTTPDLLASDNSWIVASGGSTAQVPSCMADYAYNTLNYRKVVTVTSDEDGARAFMTPFTDEFKALGGTILDQKWTALDATDVAPYLTDLKNSNADAVVAWEAGSMAISFMTAYHQLGLDKKIPLMANYHGGFIDPWCPLAVAGSGASPAAFNGVVGPFVYSYDSQSPEWLAYMNGMAAANKGSKPKDGASNCTVQAATMLLAALQATGGNTDPKVLRDALLATNVTGPQGPQFFAKGDKAATLDVYIMKVTQGADVWHWNLTTVKTYTNVPPAGFTGTAAASATTTQ